MLPLMNNQTGLAINAECLVRSNVGTHPPNPPGVGALHIYPDQSHVCPLGFRHLLHISRYHLPIHDNPNLLSGTYSTQPAAAIQTFGHKYGGFIYAFLFSGDLINNFLTATMSSVRDKDCLRSLPLPRPLRISLAGPVSSP